MTNGFEYVADLSLNEKLVFLRMIIRLIGKDSHIDDSERAFMKELAYNIKFLGNVARK